MWIELAAGVVSAGASADALLSHAAECDVCAAQLKAALALFVDGEEEDVESSAVEIANLATRMATPPPVGAKVLTMPSTGSASQESLSHLNQGEANQGGASFSLRGASAPPPVPARPSRYTWLATAAAAALVLIAAGLWYMRSQQSSAPLELLAKSYALQRPFDPRLAGASYGPVRVERGSASNTQPELLEARLAIKLGLDAHPEDAHLLHAKGRAELLMSRFEDAIATFQKAAGLGLDEPAFWVDFGVAYFQRGDPTQSVEDYAAAEKLWNQALAKQPGLTAALFNRGIVYARQKRMDLARADFEAVAAAESDADWRRDAAKQIEDLR